MEVQYELKTTSKTYIYNLAFQIKNSNKTIYMSFKFPGFCFIFKLHTLKQNA